MNYMVNPMTLLQMIRGGQNPQQLLMSILQNKAGNNPYLNNLFQLAQRGDTKGIEQVARNTLKSQGKDFDTEFQNFRKNFNI